MRPGHAQTLVVASHNPVKIEATRRGFASMFPGLAFHLHVVAVPSGGRPPPLSDSETVQGGLHTGQHAAPPGPPAHFWGGIESRGGGRPGSLGTLSWDLG